MPAPRHWGDDGLGVSPGITVLREGGGFVRMEAHGYDVSTIAFWAATYFGFEPELRRNDEGVVLKGPEFESRCERMEAVPWTLQAGARVLHPEEQTRFAIRDGGRYWLVSSEAAEGLERPLTSAERLALSPFARERPSEHYPTTMTRPCGHGRFELTPKRGQFPAGFDRRCPTCRQRWRLMLSSSGLVRIENA